MSKTDELVPSLKSGSKLYKRATTHHKNHMNLYKVTGLSLLTILVVACGTKSYPNHKSIAKIQPIESKKEPKITAAEQLSFILCKQNQGQYKSHHDKDLRRVLSTYNIDYSILDTDDIKLLAQKYVDDGVCDFYANYNRIWDMVPKKGEGKLQFKNLTGWKRAVIIAMSEGECRTQLGELNNKERARYVMAKLEQVAYPVDTSENDMKTLIKENSKATVWLALEKKNNGNCLWMPE